jgi:catechol O-methyltransferase
MASNEEKAAKLREYIFSQPASDLEDNPWAVTNAVEDFADTFGLRMIFRKNKLELAREQIMAQQPAPRTIIEFGTFVGKSALAWGAILRDIHGESLPADVKVYTFEMDPAMAAVARDLIKLARLENTVHVLEGPGSESLQKLVADGTVKSVDMAFFDHWEKYYLPDLQLVERLKLWRVGSLAIADNTDYPGAPAYLQYVKNGGSGLPGTVKYESRSLETPGVNRGPVS